MKLKRLILALLFLSYPLTLVHRVLNDDVEIPMHFPFNKITTDLQWYILDLGSMFSILFVLIAFILYVFSNLRNDWHVKILILTISLVWLIDIVHYVLWFRQKEFVLLCEGIIVVIGTCIMYLKNGAKNKN